MPWPARFRASPSFPLRLRSGAASPPSVERGRANHRQAGGSADRGGTAEGWRREAGVLAWAGGGTPPPAGRAWPEMAALGGVGEPGVGSWFTHQK